MTLTQKQAEYRSSLIAPESISYNLHLSLYPKFYRSFSQCKFALHSKGEQQLFIDCSSKKIINYVINGKKVENIKQEESLLYFEMDALVIGENTVFVQCQNEYNTDERGLMSFVDVDHKQYLYTTLEAYFAHRVFSVFDQPDLKATMTLSVICPLPWTKVLSNEHATFNQQLNETKYLAEVPTLNKNHLTVFVEQSCKQYKTQQIKQLRMASFPKTKLMPTYLFCVVAGPFEQIALPKQQQYNKIPMSLYCSAQQLPHVQKMAPFLFETTLECMKFFEQFFRVPYAFSKYDQIFVHEMESCAMENTGIVTYHDAEYIWRDDVTQQMALDLADTMAHELAHHWFGNLTTMKWWDDLWLNESFAEFVGYYCMEVIQKRLKIVKYQSSMAQFLNKKFERGYRDDQSVTTHPIRGAVANTAVAESIFDGITYVKGASTLKQLLFLMGQQNFSAALQKYFTKFAFKNTTLDDFIDCLQQRFDNEYGLNLQEWKQAWLQSCSLNELEPVWWKMYPQGTQTEKILTVIQRPYTQKYPMLRPHKIKIALFKPDCTFDVIATFIPASPQIDIPIDPNNAQNYQAILLNYKDHTFAKVVLDSLSREFFLKNMLKIKDTLTRTYIWRIFYDMVKDAAIPSTQYITFFKANIREEISDVIVERNYESALECIQEYTPQKYRTELFDSLFYFTLQTLKQTAPENKNRLITLQDSLCKLANCEQHAEILHKWYIGKQPNLAKHQTSKANQWLIVTKIFQHLNWTNQQKMTLLNKQAQKDPSDEGKLQMLKCTVISASQQQFQTHYLSLLDPSSTLTVNTKKYLIDGLTSNTHSQKLHKNKSKYFDDLAKCVKTLQSQHVRLMIINMQPTDDNLEETIAKLKTITIDDPKRDKAKYKMNQLIDKLEKRLKAYSKFMSALTLQK